MIRASLIGFRSLRDHTESGQDLNSVVIGCLCAAGCEAIFGLSYVFTKQATADASAFALLGWRFLIAFVVMSLCILTGVIKVRLKGKKLRSVLLVALFDPAIYFIGETVGISCTTASESGVFLACIPVASLVASSLILDNKPKKIQVLGILITLSGVLFTVFAVGMNHASFSVTGYVFLVVAVLSYALYSVFVDKAEAFSSVEITYGMIAVGAVVFTILAIGEAMVRGSVSDLAALPFRNTSFLAAVLYQGIGCSILAFFLSNAAIAKAGVNRTASFIGLSTVVSILAGALLLKETFSAFQIVGAVVILIGVYVANSRKSS